MARIAVEETLSDVEQALKNSGHEVVALNQNNAKNCHYCVVSGMDMNVLGMSDTVTQATVINAEGLTADEVVQRINGGMQQSH